MLKTLTKVALEARTKLKTFQEKSYHKNYLLTWEIIDSFLFIESKCLLTVTLRQVMSLGNGYTP